MVLAGWMLRRPMADAPDAPALHLRRTVRLAGWAVLALLVVSIVANIAGNVSFARMVTSAVIDSGYMAILLYAGVGACVGILHALLRQPELANRRLLRRHDAALESVLMHLFVTAAVAGWLLYSADRFRVWRPLRAAGAWLLGLGLEVGTMSIHLGDVVIFLFATWLAQLVARATRHVLRDELAGHAALPRGVGSSIASLSYYGVLAVGLLIALSAAGFKVSQLTLVFGALGVGIGFGLQNVVNNFVSGIVLMFERPIQPGDVIDAAGSSGTVREIGLRATTIRTFEGADLIVPNGQLLNGNLTNWTMYDRRRRVDVEVRIDGATDPERVLALLGEVARATSGVAETPAPDVLATAYDDNALVFLVRGWVADLDAIPGARSSLLTGIARALHDAGIAVASRRLDLHVRSAPDGIDALVKRPAR